MRRAVYPKRVQTGRMTAAEAEREIGRMQAVYDTIAKLFGRRAITKAAEAPLVTSGQARY
ncbi:MAG: hypothetical protein JO249_24050 [Acidobacteria bacterium]|nr:hypothetical protein [Acidobacteriota bacterium]